MARPRTASTTRSDATLPPRSPGGDQVFTLHGADEPYRLAIEKMDPGTATLSCDGVVLSCDRRLADIVETTPDALVGRAFGELIAAEEAPVWRRLLGTARTEPCCGEVTSPGARVVPLQLCLSPMPDGAAATVCLVAMDLSEVRERELQLARLQATRDTAEQLGRLGSWEVDTSTGEAVWSPMLLELLDAGAEDLAGDLRALVERRVHPDDSDRLLDAFAAQIGGGGVRHQQFRVIHRDGSVHVLAGPSRMEPGPDGGLTRLVGCLQDVTETLRLQQDLRDTAERFRLLAENASDVVFHQVEGVIEWIGPSVEERLGWRVEDLVGRLTVALWHADDREAVTALREAAYAGVPGQAEARIRTRDGRYVWVDATVRPYTAEDGRSGMVGALRDIQAEVEAREAVAASEELYRSITSTAHDGIFVHTREGRIVAWNERASSLLGLDTMTDLDDPRGGWQLGSWEFVHEDGRPFTPDERPSVVTLTTGQACIDVVVGFTRDGEQRWLNVSTSPLTSPGQDLPHAVAVTVRDVTEERRAREALRESEAMRDLAEKSGRMASWSTDLATGETSWSAGVSALYDIDRRTLTHEPAGRDLMSAVLSRVDRADREVMLRRLRHPEAGRASVVDYRVRHRDGSEHIISGTAEVEYDDSGAAVRISGYQQDVTEQRRAEDEIRALNADLERRVRERTAELAARTAQLEASAERLRAANLELESFSYSVSHDLRAPLRAIDGFSEILVEDYAAVLDEAGLGHLARIRDGAQRMGRLIDDLLALSRIGRHELKLAEVDLSETAAAVLADLRASAPDRRVEAAVQPGCRATADRGLVTILLTNLLGNAWKFTAGRQTAHIDVGAREEGGATVFFVRDDGAGFDAADADKLFRPFSRLHAQSEFAGSGIGLAIVQRIVTRHGGRCWAEGEVGAGATFFFTLPDPAVAG